VSDLNRIGGRKVGYHIKVTRGDEKPPITEDEFARAARKIPELRYDVSVGKAEYFRQEELRATLMLQEGEIWTKVPEPDVIDIMLRLAEGFGAQVRGDEGERFISPTESIPAEEGDESEEEKRGERWKRIRGVLWNTYRIVIVATLLYFLVRKLLR
jgi:hypothetical protein